MAENPSIDRLRRASQERRKDELTARLRADRVTKADRADGRRRADILEHGTPEERAALRREYEEQHRQLMAAAKTQQEEFRLAQLAKRAQTDFYAALELETGIKWSYGEPPDRVVYTPRWMWWTAPYTERWG